MEFYYLGCCYQLLGNRNVGPILPSQPLLRSDFTSFEYCHLERRLDEAVGKYMYRGRKRQSAAGEEGRKTHEMATFLSGSSQDRDRDAPGAVSYTHLTLPTTPYV